MQQNHGGSGDNVGGNKTTYVTIAIRWTIVAGFCAAMLGWYLIWGQPDKKPIADFKIHSEFTKNGILVSGIAITFDDLSKDSYRNIWTLDSGKQIKDKKKVQRVFNEPGTYRMKLEVFSENGEKNDIISKEFRVFPSTDPINTVEVKLIIELDNDIVIQDINIPYSNNINVISWRHKSSNEGTFGVIKGVQSYGIDGYALNRNNKCKIQGNGNVEFIEGATYRIFFSDKSTCTMKMERVN
jgi:PKD repeat protein